MKYTTIDGMTLSYKTKQERDLERRARNLAIIRKFRGIAKTIMLISAVYALGLVPFVTTSLFA